MRTDLMALENQVGTVKVSMELGSEGQTSVFGVLWRSVSDCSIPQGEKVRVLKRHGLTLLVEPVRKNASAATLAF